MNEPQLIDTPVVVEAKLNAGKLQPQTVTWQNRTYRVTGIGRQWLEADGTHVLVELHDQSRMEVCLSQQLAWRLCRYWPGATVV